MTPFLKGCYHATKCQINRCQHCPTPYPDNCVPMRSPIHDKVVQLGSLNSNSQSWGAQSRQGSNWTYKKCGERGNCHGHAGC